MYFPYMAITQKAMTERMYRAAEGQTPGLNPKSSLNLESSSPGLTPDP